MTTVTRRHASIGRRLRLGIDLDGVVADFNAGWMARYNRDFQADLRPEQIIGWDQMGTLTGFADMDGFWTWARGDGRTVFRDLAPLPGAIETLHDLAARHDIAIITARHPWAISDTLAWIADHGIAASEVHFLEDKTSVACDVYIDDAPHQLEALVAAHPRATVCRRVAAWNDPLDGATDVHDWNEFRAVVDRLTLLPRG